MRIVVYIAGIYAGILWLIIQIHEQQFTTNIRTEIATATERMIAINPIDHRHTLFSRSLIAQVEHDSPYTLPNLPAASQVYEFVTMSPCNPRIQNCN